MVTIKDMRKSYPINAFSDIIKFGHSRENFAQDLSVYYDRPDVLYLFEYFVFKHLSRDEAEIFHLYYRDKLAINKICEKYNITNSRFATIRKRILSKLENCSFSYILVHGLGGYENKLLDEGKEKGYEIGYKNGYNDGYKDGHSMLEKEKNFSLRQGTAALKELNELPHIVLEDLPLTTRAYSCLHRYGLKTLRDVAVVSPEELDKIRNLGKVSYSEIVELLSKYGVNKEPFIKYLHRNDKE
ncbi:DNA-directed RNA polymerase subunit alpha C-terminal domain-containing protein [Ruminococcus flavefaciens]|uniref:DNA-directed RNA polymerase subunit alpha C-terminal domain-containing protein n=1 Tax=Ruminococcus flavefaciens TaxID=1265 RepID=UPI0026F30BC7|nr:DNA-directed RNA polymerase subunit alpha C-terminal domain-containing protein [Ruminococcus flavefaciens]